jgi:hypothetical protein
MIEHVWSVLCGRAVTDRETNNMSLLEVIEQVNLLGPMPEPGQRVALPIPFEVVSLWSRGNPNEREESTGRIKIIAPNNAEVLAHEFSINLIEHARVRTQMRSVGIPLAGVGRYVFSIEIKRPNEIWETVAKIPLQVESMAQAPVAAA